MTSPQELKQVRDSAVLMYSRQEISQVITRMAREITDELAAKVAAGEPLVVISVMNGALYFTAELTPQLGLEFKLDHCHATRYRGAQTGAELQWRSRPSQPLKDACVLLLDDILDEGHTLADIREFCLAEGAASVYTAVLVDKQHSRRTERLPKADYSGMPVDDHYVFGYGMDYQDHLRHLPGIYRLGDS